MTPLNEAICIYERNYRPRKEVTSEIQRVLRGGFLKHLCKGLHLCKPRIVCIKPPESNCVGLYIGGTNDHPVICIVDSEFDPEVVEMDRAVESTIVHELIHAYLETCGIDSEDQDEEFVEDKARMLCDGRGEAFKGVLTLLDKWVEENDPEA